MSTSNFPQPPPFLFVPTLALWGVCVRVPWFGVVLGVLLEFLRFARLQRDFDNSDFNRVSDLASLLSGGCAIYFLVAIGITEGLLRAVTWMPITTLPLLLAQLISADHVRLRNLFYSLRQSTLPKADQQVDLLYPYFIFVLIAASIATTNQRVFLPGATLLIAYALLAVRTRHRPFWLWAILVSISLGMGAVLSVGLYQLQSVLDNLVSDWMFNYSPETNRSRTRIGDVGHIKLSDAIVWRIQTDRPLREPLLLVDAGYTSYSGGTWHVPSHRDDYFRPLLATGGEGYFVLGEKVEPLAQMRLSGYTNDGRALLALPSGTHSISGLAVGDVSMNAFNAVKIAQAAPMVTLSAAYTPQTILRAPPTTMETEVPKSLASLFSRVRNQIPLRSTAATDIVQAIRRFFDDGFRYSLYLGDQAGGKDLNNFLTESRSGHCEYFATATTLLLRSFGVPTRYVTGYSVHEFVASERQYVARHRHAHAWTQAYVDGAWQNVDTTPAIWAEAEAEQRNPFASVMDWFSWRWFHYTQWRAQSQNGLERWLFGGILLVCAWIYWRLFRRPRTLSTVEKPSGTDARRKNSAYSQMEAELTGFGYPRPPGETPYHWLQRLRTEECPYLTDTTMVLIHEHYVFRYCPNAEKVTLQSHLSELIEHWRSEIIKKQTSYSSRIHQ